MPDAIEMLQVDHRKVESLFERCQSSPDPRVVEQICNELTIHALVEEQVIYPLLDQLPGGAEMRQEAEQEHQRVKEAIAQIERAGYDPEQVGSLLQQLMDDVNHHVEEEESEVLPKMREALGEERLTEVGQQAAQAKLENMMTIIDLDELTKDELYELAQTTGIAGRSQMDKDDLVKSLQGS